MLKIPNPSLQIHFQRVAIIVPILHTCKIRYKTFHKNKLRLEFPFVCFTPWMILSGINLHLFFLSSFTVWQLDTHVLDDSLSLLALLYHSFCPPGILLFCPIYVALLHYLWHFNLSVVLLHWFPYVPFSMLWLNIPRYSKKGKKINICLITPASSIKQRKCMKSWEI